MDLILIVVVVLLLFGKETVGQLEAVNRAGSRVRIGRREAAVRCLHAVVTQ